MSIQSEIARISDEVSNQASLISQIAAALEGKAGGSSSGTSVETCTVDICYSVGMANPTANTNIYIEYSTVNDSGSIIYGTKTMDYSSEYSTIEVAKNTIVIICKDPDHFTFDDDPDLSADGSILIRSSNSYACILVTEDAYIELFV